MTPCVSATRWFCPSRVAPAQVDSRPDLAIHWLVVLTHCGFYAVSDSSLFSRQSLLSLCITYTHHLLLHPIGHGTQVEFITWITLQGELCFIFLCIFLRGSIQVESAFAPVVTKPINHHIWSTHFVVISKIQKGPKSDSWGHFVVPVIY